MDSIIEVKDLWFSYNGHVILKEVNLKVSEKGFLAIIGPNGGGKTTLLKLMVGLLKPNRGSIKIFGKTPGEVSSLIGYLPQESSINKDFPISVFDVVLMGRLKPNMKWSRYNKQDKMAAQEVLEKVEMWSFRNSRIGELSGGQRQRVFIARSIVSEPKILFLDEPTSSIDSKGQTYLYNLLKKLNESIIIIIVSHDLMVLSTYVKSVACVNQCLHYHDDSEFTNEMFDILPCPVELIAHGVPHRVFQKH
ncbi:MAG: ABC transporter ATP-binding protein [Desulfobacterales bacterium]|nr:ABC transporter ATP-binding protein [Desulfobacterales bacterium]